MNVESLSSQFVGPKSTCLQESFAFKSWMPICLVSGFLPLTPHIVYCHFTLAQIIIECLNFNEQALNSLSTWGLIKFSIVSALDERLWTPSLKLPKIASSSSSVKGGTSALSHWEAAMSKRACSWEIGYRFDGKGGPWLGLHRKIGRLQVPVIRKWDLAMAESWILHSRLQASLARFQKVCNAKKKQYLQREDAEAC